LAQLEFVERAEFITPPFEDAMELFQVQLQQIAQKRQSFGSGKLCQGSHSRVGEISADMRELLDSGNQRASFAVDLFVYRIARELGSLAAALGGLDALVFTGGIGENAPAIRARVCRDAAWLGLVLDEEANAKSAPCISGLDSRVSAWVIPTDEELMVASHTRQVLASSGG
jgi:acetate kinase